MKEESEGEQSNFRFFKLRAGLVNHTAGGDSPRINPKRIAKQKRLAESKLKTSNFKFHPLQTFKEKQAKELEVVDREEEMKSKEIIFINIENFIHSLLPTSYFLLLKKFMPQQSLNF